MFSFSLLWNLWSQCCTFIYVELDVDNFVVLAIVSSIFCYLYPARAIRALSFFGAILRTWILKSIWEGLTIWNSPESSRKWQFSMFLLFAVNFSFILSTCVDRFVHTSFVCKRNSSEWLNTGKKKIVCIALCVCVYVAALARHNPASDDPFHWMRFRLWQFQSNLLAVCYSRRPNWKMIFAGAMCSARSYCST